MDKCVKDTLKCLYERNHFNWDENLDLYANYASQLYGIPYEECLEWKNNEPYPIGKERRHTVKLAVLTEGYLMGTMTPTPSNENEEVLA